MRQLIITIAALIVSIGVFAEDMRLSDSIPCKYLGSLFYGDNVGYQLNFETGSLRLRDRRGKGDLISVTLVVPRKGNKSNVLPEGEFILGSSDTLMINTLDYYASSVRHYGENGGTFRRPDSHNAFQQCTLKIDKQEKGSYVVRISYRLRNGEQGDYIYMGRVKPEKHDKRARFNFMPKNKGIKNWQLTDAKLELQGTTAFSSRKATLVFVCGDDFYGMAVVYLPIDGVNGHYVVRYGKMAGSCEKSVGGYDSGGYYNLYNTGIQDDFEGYFYYPESGYIDITDEKTFFEFVSRDGSIVRGVFKGKIRQ